VTAQASPSAPATGRSPIETPKHEPLNYLFDLDGTLADSIPGIGLALAQAFASIGRVMPNANLRDAIGPPIRIISKRLDPTLTDAETLAIEQAYRPLYDHSTWRDTALFPQVRETLHALHRAGKNLFVVTNKPRIPTQNILDHAGLRPLFHDTITRDSRTPHFDTKADMIAALVERHRLDPVHSVMVGDTAEDHEAAVANHMPFVFATYGYGTDPTALSTIHHFPELLAQPAANRSRAENAPTS
jgi:phosphoglycolate phosphatase